jgi:hypothetical protein
MMALLQKLFVSRRRDCAENAFGEFMERVSDGGYVAWIDRPPVGQDFVQAIRFEWPDPQFIEIKYVRPEFNVAGLYWRPAKIKTIEGALSHGIEVIEVDG